METLEVLGRRISTTRDLQSIVRTMKTLSAVTIRRSERAAQAVRAYDESIDRGLQIVLRDAQVAASAIAASQDARATGPMGLIVLGSDHGLCGRFNDVAVAAALDDIAANGRGDVRVAAVGARAADLLTGAGHAPAVVYGTPGSVAGLRATTGALLALADTWRSEMGIARLRIAHAVQTAEAPARPVAMPLLPVSPAYLRHQASRPWPSRRLPTYTEAREVMLARLIREHVFVRIYRALAEAQTSEHASRLAAMQSAERGIRDHLAEMDAAFRQRRQEQITTEMLDVVAGAAALARR
ncbi:F-type H+-transporting ATPase subunit gamma [Rhodovulum iodosum]|uniref:F-type H+-transporting ATPase subunit gamma n=1 Tax=Rhodovulum iodosum TaxID=68291 RepID=A0ABV3XTY9_9RHOB|nr:FoF1 ATP synthase subunit gamma [Rhodovulum robiginosum]RSK32225.1 F0F1 ATP synthase subunit gamma [Rhodovulum robiginosum]